MSGAIGWDPHVLLPLGCLIIRSDRVECLDDERKPILSLVSPRSHSDPGTSRRNLLPEVANSNSQAWVIVHSGVHRTSHRSP